MSLPDTPTGEAPPNGRSRQLGPIAYGAPVTFGEPDGVQNPPPDSPAVGRERRAWLSFVTKARIGILVGIVAAIVTPPTIVSFDRVGKQVIGAARKIDQGEVARGGDRPRIDASANGHQPQNPSAPAIQESPVRDQIVAAITRQATALQTADLPGFLAPVDPADVALRAQLTKRFLSLRAMRVVTWSQTIAGKVGSGVGGEWIAPVQLRYCFVVTTCVPTAVTVETHWLITPVQTRLTQFGSSPADQVGPRPWEVSELQAVVGNRVVVAGTKKWASRLSGVLASAERAAAVTDRYAKWGPPPSRYVVYVAGPDEWAQWYGVQQASWVAAYAMPLTDTYTEIVLNATKVSVADSREVLQHEFTHVVTLAGVHKTYQDSWWLIEGIAEYVQNVGTPISAYRALSDGRKYVHSGAWNGTVALGEPSTTATTSEANGEYAVAYLAVRRLSERFGEQRMLEFFNAVARNGQGLESASVTVLGQPWAQVADDCARYVRRGVG